MASQLKINFSPKLWDKTNVAVKHFIKTTNEHDNMAPFHGFSSAYISNVTAYATFVEHDSRFAQSLIDQYDVGTHCTKLFFACEISVIAFFSDCMEQVTVASSTVSGVADAIQKWVNVVEGVGVKFQVKNPSVKRSIDKQRGVRKNVQLKQHKHVDVISMFDQRTLSVDSESKLNEIVFNYHKHGVLFKDAMLFAVQFKIVQSNSDFVLKMETCVFHRML